MGEMMRMRCPFCGAWNQFPEARLNDGPKCGQCKTGLVGPDPRPLDEAGFNAALADHGTPLIVDFWASWCSPCRVFSPHFSAIAKTYGARGLFAKIDVDAMQSVAARYNVSSIPTLIAFRGGQQVERVLGGPQGQRLDEWVRRALDLPPLPAPTPPPRH